MPDGTPVYMYIYMYVCIYCVCHACVHVCLYVVHAEAHEVDIMVVVVPNHQDSCARILYLTSIYTYIFMYTYTYTHTYTHAHMHTYTYTCRCAKPCQDGTCHVCLSRLITYILRLVCVRFILISSCLMHGRVECHV